MKMMMKSMVMAVVLMAGTIGFAADGEWDWSIAPYAWLSASQAPTARSPEIFFSIKIFRNEHPVIHC